MLDKLEHFLLRLESNLIEKNFPMLYKGRPPDAHKGSLGSLAVLGGSRGMEGALILAGRSALKAGCGKVFLHFTQRKVPLKYVDSAPELMVRSYRDYLELAGSFSATVFGCGLGLSSLAEEVFYILLDASKDSRTVLDADALNLLTKYSGAIKLNPQQHILTPHMGEAARLLGVTIKQVQDARLHAAQILSEKYAAIVVLKGPSTIVYSSSEKKTYSNSTGNAGLATAGTGDVLAGMIGSFLAQGYAPWEAATAGVFLHGLAADWLVFNGIGPIGLTASELTDAARLLHNAIVCQHTTEEKDYEAFPAQ
ncbi:MAG: NAD(P)H-hydrate dehydratase [Neisseriaceae bacterium]